MNRRAFFKVGGAAAAAAAVYALPIGRGTDTGPNGAVPAGATIARVPVAVPEAGTYRITGVVRMQQPLVEIGGLTHGQTISWSGVGDRTSTFTAFEHFASPAAARAIEVRGGVIESVSAELVDYA